MPSGDGEVLDVNSQVASTADTTPAATPATQPPTDPTLRRCRAQRPVLPDASAGSLTTATLPITARSVSPSRSQVLFQKLMGERASSGAAMTADATARRPPPARGAATLFTICGTALRSTACRSLT